MMVDTPFAGFTVPPRGYVDPTDVFLGVTAGGGGVNIAGSAVVAKAANGNVGIGTPTPLRKLHVNENGNARVSAIVGNDLGYIEIGAHETPGNGAFINVFSSQPLVFGTDNLASPPTRTEFMRLDGAGRLLVGATSGIQHTISRAVAEGTGVLQIDNATADAALFFGATGAGGSSAASTLRIRANSVTGRAISAGGTISGSGADPAEYWRRALSCGPILSGQICGINADNELTTDFADAVRFGVKSGLINQPFMVGNDVYARVHEAAAGPEPTAPPEIALAPVEPVAPLPFDVPEPVRAEAEDELAFAMRLVRWTDQARAGADAMQAYIVAATAYPPALAEWTELNAAYQAELAAYEAADTAWQAGLEAERERWDRISIGGQVYIRTEQSCAAGDYVIPIQDGEGIGFSFVPDAEITFDQYRHKLGVVLTTTGEWPLIEVIRS